MKTSEVIKEISKKLDLKPKDIENCINKLVEIIITKNSMGETVNISNLGRFMIVKKNERTVRNPKTGQITLCKEYYSPKFKAKPIYKKTVKSSLFNKNIIKIEETKLNTLS